MIRYQWQSLVGVGLMLWAVGGFLGPSPAEGASKGSGYGSAGRGAAYDIFLDSGAAPEKRPESLNRRWAERYGKTAFESNGEQIFYTGTSARTGQILTAGGPRWVRTGGSGCVACHGVRGRGGVPFMNTNLQSGDIREVMLNFESAPGKPGAPDPESVFKHAVTKGLEPSGEALDIVMPRWQMEDADLADLIAYLKTFRW
jgi:cytochrome c oxidase subunit II